MRSNKVSLIARPHSTVVLLALVAILGGCAPAMGPSTEPLTPGPAPTSLVGRWKGEWGGKMTHPMEVVIEKQEGSVVWGTVTFYLHGSAPTHPMRGTTETRPDGSVWVHLKTSGSEFPLRVVGNRLEGTGQSARHYGPVILTRE